MSAELSRVLAEDGEVLAPSITGRIFRSLRTDAEAREREERRGRYLAERAAAERLDMLRPWALWVGVPTAALVPSATAAALAGWGPLDVLAELAELPWLLGPSAAFCAAAGAALGAVAWLAAAAETMGQLWRRLGCALAAGALLLFGAEAMPVHLASDGARIAGGASIGGSIVRVEHLWPRNPDRLHIFRGTGPVRRGQVLELRGGQPERWLQRA